MQRLGAHSRIFFLILAFYPLLALANPHTRGRFGLVSGAVLPCVDGSSYGATRPVLGAEVALEFLPDYSHPWGTHFNGSGWGLAAAYYNYGSASLGNAVAIYPFLDFHLVYRAHFLLSLRPGAGVAYGPELEAYTSAQLAFEFPIRDGWSLEATAGAVHMGNGNLHEPNPGVNLATAQLSAKFFPHHYAYRQPQNRTNLLTWRDHAWLMEVVGAGGARQADGRMEGIASLQVAGFYRPWQIFRIGLGADGFYDGAYREPFRVGFSLMPELVIGQLTAGLGFGGYVWNPQGKADSRKSQDGWFYQRAQLRYRCTKHFLVSLALKTHLQHPECLELGVGYSL